MSKQENIEGIGAGPVTPELFTGGFPLTEALRQLRLRLLDLTARNRLLNFKPSKGKSLQFVETLPNAAYQRLLDSKSCTFLPIPDPTPGDYDIQDNRRIKPDVRDRAK